MEWMMNQRFNSFKAKELVLYNCTNNLKTLQMCMKLHEYHKLVGHGDDYACF